MRSYGVSERVVIWAISVLFLCCGCSSQTTKISIVEIKPITTEEGVKLETLKRKTLAYKEVIERSPNVRSVTRITDNEKKDLVIGPPILSPIEDILIYPEMPLKVMRESYYTARLSRQSNLFKKVIGLPGKTSLTNGRRTDMYPTFTPDGQSIIFSSNRTGPNPTLWQISLAGGGGITKITSTLAEDYAPCVFPDVSFIAYTSNPPGALSPEIWKVNPNGLLPTQLREGQSPQISPDGKKILFLRKDRESGKTQLWMMNTDGSEETQLTSNTDYIVKDAKWSPKGDKIVYASNEGVDSRKRQNFDIWMMDASGIRTSQLTTNGSFDDSPCWDRDGRFIYFRSNRGVAWNIWRFEPIVP